MNLLLLKNNIYILIIALNKDPVKPSSNTELLLIMLLLYLGALLL